MKKLFGKLCRCIYFTRQNLVCILLQGVHSILAPLMHFRASSNEQGCTFCVPIGKKAGQNLLNMCNVYININFSLLQINIDLLSSTCIMHKYIHKSLMWTYSPTFHQCTLT